jgi:predicted MPP superfamily phosphohydrolase
LNVRNITRRQFLRSAAFGAAGAGAALGGYSALVEPNEITVERLQVRLPGLPEAFDGFRIAQLSDLHYGPYTGAREIGAAVRQANALRPDAVALTGDYITSPMLDRVTASPGVLHHAAECAGLLAGLQAPAGVFACLGNHDVSVSADDVTAAISRGRVTVLRNANRVIERDGARLWMAALDDALYGRPDFSLALSRIPGGDTVILLAHEPDLADDTAGYPVALQLSGHSHGGQVRIPVLGSPYLPQLARKYPYGHYRVGNLELYTNRGIGTIVLPLRFDAPPEVTLITLRR